MPLLKAKAKTEKKQVRIYIRENVLDRAEEYRQWAGLERLDDFFEQAAQLVFKKDREWREIKKER